MHDLADDALHVDVGAHAARARQPLLPLHGDEVATVG
jgi:hypothetical protein